MIAWLRRIFCRHRKQSDPFQAGATTYFRCFNCGAFVNVDKFFADEP